MRAKAAECVRWEWRVKIRGRTMIFSVSSLYQTFDITVIFKNNF